MGGEGRSSPRTVVLEGAVACSVGVEGQGLSALYVHRCGSQGPVSTAAEVCSSDIPLVAAAAVAAAVVVAIAANCSRLYTLTQQAVCFECR